MSGTVESIADFFPNCSERYILLTENSKRNRFSEEMKEFMGRIAVSQPDVLVYLDKSARPVSWLFNKAWSGLFPDVRKPETKFLNVGREKILPVHPDVLADNLYQPTHPLFHPSEEAARAVRQIYTKSGRNDETHLDGKSVCVVDEFTVTGGSINSAAALLDLAFGDRLPGPVAQETVFSEEPMWYQDKWAIGVEDSDESSFLVCRPEYPRNSHQLRGELNQLAQDLVAQN